MIKASILPFNNARNVPRHLKPFSYKKQNVASPNELTTQDTTQDTNKTLF